MSKLDLKDTEVVELPSEENATEMVSESTNNESTTDVVVFVSGPTDINEKDFMQYYFPVLASLSRLEQKIYFVMSDEDGTALLTQMALNELLKDKSVVSIFNIGDNPENYVSTDYVCVPGFKSIEERDAAMTAASNKDLHIVLGGKGTSAVEHNICRRLTPKYDYRKYLSPEYNLPYWGILFNMITPEQLEKLKEQQVLNDSSNDENENKNTTL